MRTLKTRTPPRFRSWLVAAALLLPLVLLVSWFVKGRGPLPARPTRTWRDMAGRTVQLPVPLERVVTNGGVLEEWILMLGGQRRLVATSVSNRNNPWIVKLWPQIKNLPIAFSAEGNVNLEELLGARPDAILMLSGLASQHAVEKAQLPVVVLERRNATDIKEAVLQVGRLLGPDEEATAVSFGRYYDNVVGRVTRLTQTLPAPARVKVYYAAAGNPLSTDGRNTMASLWIAQAGGVNVADGALEGLGRNVTLEEIVRWNPEVIVSSTRAAKEQIERNPGWSEIAAVRNRRVYVNPKGLYLWARNSSETALQTLWAAKTLHPELFPDLDLKEETRSFFATFFHYRPSEEELQGILDPER